MFFPAPQKHRGAKGILLGVKTSWIVQEVLKKKKKAMPNHPYENCERKVEKQRVIICVASLE